MNEDALKRRLILDLAVKDLLKVMNVIDGKNVNVDNSITSLDEIQFLDLETKLINDVKSRLENIFKE